MYTDPIGPEWRTPLTGPTLFSAAPVQIGWAYLNAAGLPIRAEITESSWLDIAGLPGKALRRQDARAPYSVAFDGRDQ